jgi:hypothetical protein
MDPVACNWVHRVVALYVGQHNNHICLLQGQFSAHMNSENISALQTAGVKVVFILAGYTPILQAMDKGFHKPFKQYPRHILWL